MSKPSKPKPVLLSTTALAYLTIALDKQASVPHPNFIAALKAKRAEKDVESDREKLLARIRHACARAVDAKIDIRVACIGVGKTLRDSAQAYTTFWKQLMGDVAFAASMDALSYERSADPAKIDEGLNLMGDVEHDCDFSDIPTFDESEAQRATEREPYSGPELREPIATDFDDVVSALGEVQTWIGLAVGHLTDAQRLFWGVDGVFPLGQSRDEAGEYHAITDFDAYRAWSKKSWRAKQDRVGNDEAIDDLMAQA